MKRLSQLLAAAALVSLAACSAPQSGSEDLTRWVDPKIGTGGHGHVFVGANVPFGLVQVGPTSIPQDWDWCSGYHESDSTVIGFSHTHLSGTGIGDLFDVTVMPVTGDVTYARGTGDDPSSGLWSYADRTKEVARPGYYSVPLTRYGITAEMTATSRVGLHRYTFPASEEAAVVFDLENGGCWDRAVGTHLEQIDARTIAGWRYSTGWAKDQKVYFVAEFSKPAKAISYLQPGELVDSKMPLVDARYARVDFDTAEGEQLLVKVALSPVSIEGAEANLAAELPGWDFDTVAAAATAAWDKELSKVRITTSDETARRIFYTALYHTLIHPNVLDDVNGEYPLMEDSGTGRVEEGRSRYTVFSLWDTYRNLHQLMTLVYPERQLDMVRSMVDIYREWGWMPKWELYGRETFTMEGDPAIPVIADTWLKGLRDFDIMTAYGAFLKSATTPGENNRMRPDIDPYIEKGYIPLGVYSADLSGDNSVSHALEYYVADNALSILADSLGCPQDAERFRKASLGYVHYYCPEYGTLRPLLADGSFYSPFDPRQGENFETAPGFHEGSAWNYTFYVPHDIAGLTRLNGKILHTCITFCRREERYISSIISRQFERHARLRAAIHICREFPPTHHDLHGMFFSIIALISET